jgi:hypothetical protein
MSSNLGIEILAHLKNSQMESNNQRIVFLLIIILSHLNYEVLSRGSSSQL